MCYKSMIYTRFQVLSIKIFLNISLIIFFLEYMLNANIQGILGKIYY